ncbi:MAG: hypothetical protein P8X63_02605 [Desulfuromonadaceae bacterium]
MFGTDPGDFFQAFQQFAAVGIAGIGQSFEMAQIERVVPTAAGENTAGLVLLIAEGDGEIKQADRTFESNRLACFGDFVEGGFKGFPTAV